jgi:hypothetical protein
LAEGEAVEVRNAPTVFGQAFGYRLVHRASARRVEINVTAPPPSHVRLVYPCRFGSGVQSAVTNLGPATVSGRDVQLPKGATSATITYTM